MCQRFSTSVIQHHRLMFYHRDNVPSAFLCGKGERSDVRTRSSLPQYQTYRCQAQLSERYAASRFSPSHSSTSGAKQALTDRWKSCGESRKGTNRVAERCDGAERYGDTVGAIAPQRPRAVRCLHRYAHRQSPLRTRARLRSWGLVVRSSSSCLRWTENPLPPVACEFESNISIEGSTAEPLIER